MWLKFTGSMLVMTASIYAGMVMARRCDDRPRHIRQIAACMETLKSCVGFMAMPLAEALENCARGSIGPVGEFFQSAASCLRAERLITPGEAVAQALHSGRSRLALHTAEKEVLRVMGANLGSIKRDEQPAYLSLIQEQLEKLAVEAVRERDQNAKMYRYLGVCGGLMIVILLI